MSGIDTNDDPSSVSNNQSPLPSKAPLSIPAAVSQLDGIDGRFVKFVVVVTLVTLATTSVAGSNKLSRIASCESVVLANVPPPEPRSALTVVISEDKSVAKAESFRNANLTKLSSSVWVGGS